MKKCEQCLVKKFNSLRTLSKDELMRISNCKTSKTIKKGELLFKEGEVLNGVFCIRDGACKVSKLSENGKDQIVKLVKKGDILGQRSLINNEATNLSATALQDVEICFIPKNEVLNNLRHNTDFSLSMLRKMALDLKETDNMFVDMAQKHVKQRLAETLIYVYETFATDEHGMLNIVLSREDYANIVGTATESAIRILSQFKKNGLIGTDGKKIKIIDLQGLKSVV